MRNIRIISNNDVAVNFMIQFIGGRRARQNIEIENSSMNKKPIFAIIDYQILIVKYEKCMGGIDKLISRISRFVLQLFLFGKSMIGRNEMNYSAYSNTKI